MKGKVRAKTGTLDEVTALAAWSDTRGRNVDLLVRHTAPRAGPLRRLGSPSRHEPAAALVAYPAGVPIDQLGPAVPSSDRSGPRTAVDGTT